MDFITIIIYLSIYVGLVATTFFILSFLADKKKEKNFFSDDELPKVSVIIPAYNEEGTISKTISSVLESDYPDFEIIFVDDGSKDKTLEIANQFKSRGVKIFSKENGGKGTALNLGISKCKGEVIFTMDADTRVDAQSMKNMARYFKDENVMSVTPAMVVEKPRSLWQRVQYIEYLMGLFLRKAFASLNAVYISPGAFSAYRKSFFDKYGGYDEGNLTEDLEMALRIQYYGHVTENCPDAPAYTVAPRTFKSLLIQRRRWYTGLIKNCWKYKRLFSRKYGDLGVFVLPIAWISIFFSLFVTCYLFVKTLLDVRASFTFFNAVKSFSLSSMFKINFLVLERALFLLITNPVFLFLLCFAILLRVYLYYASKKLGKSFKPNINLPLFFIFFAILFGFWWAVTIIYTFFNKKVKWR